MRAKICISHLKMGWLQDRFSWGADVVRFPQEKIKGDGN